MDQGLLRLFPVPNFLHPKAIGIAIEDDHVTLVQSPYPCERSDAVQIELPQGAIERGAVSDPEKVLSALSALRSHTKTPQVVLALPSDAGFVVRMEIDSEVPDLMEAITLRIEEYVPVDPENLVIDYEVIGHSDDGKWRVLVAAYPKTVVMAYEDLLKEAGFKPVAAELATHSLARAVTSGKSNESVLVVDVGRTHTHATIMVGHRPWLVSSINLGWYQMVEVAERSAQMKPAQAERAVFTYGLSGMESRDLYELMIPTVSALRDEIAKVIRFWTSHKERSWGKARAIEQVVLVGRGAGVPGMSRHISSGLSVRVRSISPWDSEAYEADQVPVIDRPGSLGYAAGVGAYLRAVNRVW